MLAFITSFLLLFAGAAHGDQPAWLETYHKYFNYPGFELWKFLNLAIFVFILVKLLRKPLSDAFKAKRESIREALVKAEAEKQAAMAMLADAEAKLAALETEKAEVLRHAEQEAADESGRIAGQAQSDVQKLKEQADAEVQRLQKSVKHELKKFAADESVRLAEAKLKERIGQNGDSRLVEAGITAIGGLK